MVVMRREVNYPADIVRIGLVKIVLLVISYKKNQECHMNSKMKMWSLMIFTMGTLRILFVYFILSQ